MGRRKGPDEKKIQRIREVLQKNTQGLWVREIARKTGLDKSTISIYISRYMKEEVEDMLPSNVRNLIRLVKVRRR